MAKPEGLSHPVFGIYGYQEAGSKRQRRVTGNEAAHRGQLPLSMGLNRTEPAASIWLAFRRLFMLHLCWSGVDAATAGLNRRRPSSLRPESLDCLGRIAVSQECSSPVTKFSARPLHPKRPGSGPLAMNIRR